MQAGPRLPPPSPSLRLHDVQATYALPRAPVQRDLPLKKRIERHVHLRVLTRFPVQIGALTIYQPFLCASAPLRETCLGI